jgi:hypothetical protein
MRMQPDTTTPPSHPHYHPFCHVPAKTGLRLQISRIHVRLSQATRRATMPAPPLALPIGRPRHLAAEDGNLFVQRPPAKHGEKPEPSRHPSPPALSCRLAAPGAVTSNPTATGDEHAMARGIRTGTAICLQFPTCLGRSAFSHICLFCSIRSLGSSIDLPP